MRDLRLRPFTWHRVRPHVRRIREVVEGGATLLTTIEANWFIAGLSVTVEWSRSRPSPAASEVPGS